METKSLTYAELGAALGITAASAKRLAIRHSWHKVQGNDGKARVAVPIERLEVKQPAPGDDTSDNPGDDTGDVTGDDTRDMSAAVAVLERHADRLEAELSAVRSRLGTVEAERDAARTAEGQVAVLQAVLEIERARQAEIRAEADRWREQATAPRGLAALVARLRRPSAA